MRLFIAINFDEKVKDSLCNYIQRLKKYSTRGNFTTRENLHLTLAFIGETSKTEEITHAMDAVTEAQFDLVLSGFGCFKRDGGDIYWIGIENNAVLNTVYKELYNILSSISFKIDNREFKPHLTLGREIVLDEAFDRAAFTELISPLSMTVKKISLMKSERVNGRMIYTEIYAKLLENAEPQTPNY